MKKLLFVPMLVFAMQYTKAQQLDVRYKPYSNGKYSMAVIMPTINNFICLLALSESEFRNKMKEYKYFVQDESGKYISYWNGGIDNFAYAKCVNIFSYNVMRNEIRFMVDLDMIYPSDVITSLFRDLKPYYKGTKMDSAGYTVDYFAFKSEEFSYEFFVTSNPKYYDIIVLRKRIY